MVSCRCCKPCAAPLSPLPQTLGCTAAQPVQKVEAFRLGGQSLLDAGLCMAGYDAAEAKQLVKVGC